MTLVRDAVGVIKELDAVQKPQDILAGLTLFTKSFGFEHVTVLQKPSVDSAASPSVLVSAAPRDFIADFDARGYTQYNPLWRQAEVSPVPFTAVETRNRRISEQEHEVLVHIHDKLDLNDGYIVPVRDDAGNKGAVMFGGNSPKQDPLHQSVLNVLGHCIYGRLNDIMKAFAGLMEIPGAEVAQVLTTRERECLQWVARGKTDFEIGIILGISARTARFHIENSKRKLGVASRVQAVTLAMRSGSIAA
jgi:LuxR family transcriptional regulator, quorum-sensing system regulator BjaR1